MVGLLLEVPFSDMNVSFTKWKATEANRFFAPITNASALNPERGTLVVGNFVNIYVINTRRTDIGQGSGIDSLETQNNSIAYNQ